MFYRCSLCVLVSSNVVSFCVFCFPSLKPHARFTWLPPHKAMRSSCNPSPSAFTLLCNISSSISERENYLEVCVACISEVEFLKSSVVAAEPAHTTCWHHSVTNLVKWVVLQLLMDKYWVKQSVVTSALAMYGSGRAVVTFRGLKRRLCTMNHCDTPLVAS